MQKLSLKTLFPFCTALLLQSCYPMANTQQSPYNMQLATTETHTKTVQPVAFSMPTQQSNIGYQSFAPVQLNPVVPTVKPIGPENTSN